MNFSQLCQDFLMNFFWIFYDFFMTIFWLYHDFLMNFSWLYHDFSWTSELALVCAGWALVFSCYILSFWLLCFGNINFFVIVNFILFVFFCDIEFFLHSITYLILFFCDIWCCQIFNFLQYIFGDIPSIVKIILLVHFMILLFVTFHLRDIISFYTQLFCVTFIVLLFLYFAKFYSFFKTSFFVTFN